jgi:hypothetical protein
MATQQDTFQQLLDQVEQCFRTFESGGHGLPLQGMEAVKTVIAGKRFMESDIIGILMGAMDHFEKAANYEPDWNEFAQQVLGELLFRALKSKLDREYDDIVYMRYDAMSPSGAAYAE